MFQKSDAPAMLFILQDAEDMLVLVSVPNDVKDDSEAADDEHEDALHHELRVLDGPVLHHRRRVTVSGYRVMLTPVIFTAHTKYFYHHPITSHRSQFE